MVESRVVIPAVTGSSPVSLFPRMSGDVPPKGAKVAQPKGKPIVVYHDVPIRTGGLFRCCIQSAEKAGYPTNHEITIISCEHCGDTIRWRDGAWEWNR